MRLPLPQSLVRASIRKRLWLGAAAVSIFIGTLVAAYALGPKPADPHGWIGLDFIAFYTGGSFVADGHAKDLYDLKAVHAFQHALGLKHGVDLGTAIGPYWNPPFYAWLFVPLAKLPYPAALATWVGFNFACIALSAWLLCRVVAQACVKTTPALTGLRPNRREVWASAGLVPVLIALSTPFIHALSHGQNTGTSLLLVTGTALLWRAKRGFAAGLVAGLLFYKPQLGAVLGVVLVLDLGSAALAGLAVTGAVLLAATLALPGTLPAFLHQLPANLHRVQEEVPYLWERHVTFKAFWRLLLQGAAVGSPNIAVRVLSSLGSLVVATLLLRAIFRGQSLRAIGRPSVFRDRLIAATIACTPLLMPFYFDYDQLLLAVPAVLFGAELLRRDWRVPLPRTDVWLLRLWPAYYAWLMLNPDVALKTRVNLAVPLLTGVAGLLVARAGRREAVVASAHSVAPPLAVAA